jgi:hypothetical protein
MEPTNIKKKEKETRVLPELKHLSPTYTQTS